MQRANVCSAPRCLFCQRLTHSNCHLFLAARWATFCFVMAFIALLTDTINNFNIVNITQRVVYLSLYVFSNQMCVCVSAKLFVNSELNCKQLAILFAVCMDCPATYLQRQTLKRTNRNWSVQDDQIDAMGSEIVMGSIWKLYSCHWIWSSMTLKCQTNVRLMNA